MIAASEFLLTLPRLAFNIFSGGLIVACALTLALPIARGLPARLRYLVALGGFGVAVFVPVVWTFVPAATVSDVAPDTAASIFVLLESLRAELALRIAEFSIPRATLIGGLIWSSIALLLLIREFFGHRAIVRKRSSWQPADAAALRTLQWPDAVPLFLAEQDGPAAVGLFRAAVVLPRTCLETLPPHTLECMTRHELAHVRWLDPQINALVRGLRALCWPSLPLWWIARIVHSEREAAADEEAATRTAYGKADYAAALVDAAAWSRETQSRQWMIAAPLGSDMEQRIVRLLHRPRHLWARAIAASLVLISGAALEAVVPIKYPAAESPACNLQYPTSNTNF